MRRWAPTLLLAVGSALTATGVSAADARAERGRDVAIENCSGCHAIGRTDASPRSEAPPFRALHERYPVEHLAEALVEGIVTGHADMPEFRFSPEDAEDLIAYLRTLE
jgi:cytochrome c